MYFKILSDFLYASRLGDLSVYTRNLASQVCTSFKIIYALIQVAIN